MKKIGFIDYFLNEWHADSYPAMIKRINPDYEVCCAYAHIEPPMSGKLSNDEWCNQHGIERVKTIEEVIEKSDYIIVLSPDNPEMHEELSDLPLKSGKPVYVDKTFATDVASAKRMFEKAKKYNTPMFTSSALNYADELKEFPREGIEKITVSYGGFYATHLIHQIEPAVVLAGCGGKCATYFENPDPGIKLEFENGIVAEMTVLDAIDYEFGVTYKDGTEIKKVFNSPFFDNFIKKLLEFFETGRIPVSHEQTMKVISIVEASWKARDAEGKEVCVPKY